MPDLSKRGSLSRHRQNETWSREQALAAGRDAIVITDSNEPDNPIVYANPAFERITGYSMEEVLGKNCRFLQGEDQDQPALEELRAAIREGRECKVLLRNYKKDGTLFWNELSISPMHDEEGNLANFLGVLDDVTERRRAEEALQISETRFRTIIEQSPLSIQILSPDGRTLQVNRAWETLWGVTLDDVAGYNLLEDQQLAAKGIMPYIQRGFAGEPTSIPPIIYDPDETLPGLTSHEEPKRWVKAFIQPIKDEAGTVREVVLMHEDITERKQAEEELRESEERFRGTFEQAAVGIAHVGTDGLWLRVNRRLCDIVGYEKEELLGL